MGSDDRRLHISGEWHIRVTPAASRPVCTRGQEAKGDTRICQPCGCGKRRNERIRAALLSELRKLQQARTCQLHVCPGRGVWVVIHRDNSTSRHQATTLVKFLDPRCKSDTFDISNWLLRQFDVKEVAYHQRYFYAASLQHHLRSLR
jgi:hypothetical protein